MNQTKNYHLSQWDAADPIRREDFNSDNAKIDTELADHAGQFAKLGNCRVEMQSYTGNGKYGESNPSTLTFSGKPKLVVILGENSFAFMTYGANRSPYLSPNSSNTGIGCGPMSCTWQENRLTFYGPTFKAQMNETGYTYHVIAFCAEDETEQA